MPQPNPLRFQRPSLPTAEAIEKYLRHSRERGWFSNFGPCAELLADRLTAATGAVALPVASGTAGLMVAIAGLRPLRPVTATETLMPAFAFPATAQAAIWNGLEPVFVDVDAEHWHLDPDALAEALAARGDRVAVVVALSSFGTPPPADVREAWENECARVGVPLLVDSAAGFGAVAGDGCPIGRQGTAEVVSFHATKPMAAGEGGAVFTTDETLAAAIRRRSNFGFDDHHQAIDTYALNAKLSEPGAAIALAALDDLPKHLEARRRNATRLLAKLPPGLGRQLEHDRSTWQFVPLLADDAEAAQAVLAAARGRVEMRTYYGALHEMPAFARYERADDLERTRELCARSFSLPMAVDLADAEIDLIADVVADGLARGERPLTSASDARAR